MLSHRVPCVLHATTRVIHLLKALNSDSYYDYVKGSDLSWKYVEAPFPLLQNQLMIILPLFHFSNV